MKLRQGCNNTPLSLVTQVKRSYVLRDEENVMIGVYLPRTRQQAKIWQFQVQNDVSASMR
jgi:hypothetical protein